MSYILHEALKSRRDSYWELLATAAGDEKSINKTIEGLSSNELDKGGRGSSISPSIVSYRVEALSVSSIQLLNNLANGWRDPREIKGDPFWTACWVSSLRHLVSLSDLSKEMFDVPELEKELGLIMQEQTEQLSWAELLRLVEGRLVDSNMVRELSHYKLKETVLSKKDIESVPPILFRVLRNKKVSLDATAKGFIFDCCQDLFSFDSFDAALIYEVGQQYGVGSYNKIIEELLHRLEGVSDPRDLIPIVYMLLNNKWMVA